MKKLFNENLEKSLKKKGINKKELAEILEISTASVTNWKSKGTYPTLEKFIKICEILEVSSDELLDLSPPGKEIIDMPKDLERDERLLLKYYREASDTEKDEILELAMKKVVKEKPKTAESQNLKIG